MMISVVIPTYKRPDLLERLLLSIERQTLQPEEVIVVDDASGLASDYASCIERFEGRIHNLSYHLLSENRGAPFARNFGIRKASNEWIALVDDDDEWLPRKLASQWAIAERAQRPLDLIYTWTRAEGGADLESYVSESRVQGDGRGAILRTNFIMSASVLVRKEALLDAGLFDEELPSCQDWDMWTRLLLNGGTCAVVPEVLTIYHRHGGESIGLSVRASQGYRMYVKRHFCAILRHTGPINVLRKLWLLAKITIIHRAN
jgi:glycosyltransferase involved in cell wall biosynthesis